MKFLLTILTALVLMSCGEASISTVSATQTIAPWSLKWFNAPQANTLYNSAEHVGAVFVLENFFQSCSYCNANAANVDALATAWKDNARVQVLDIGIDTSTRSFQLWINQHTSNHPVLMDGSQILTKQLGTTGYPSTYVLDCQLKVLYSSTGVWDDGVKAAIKSNIENSLATSICQL